MSDDNRVAIPNPDVPKAAKALRKYKRSADTEVIAAGLVMFCMLVFMYHQIGPQVVLMWWIVGAGLIATMLLSTEKLVTADSYARHVKAGNIVVVDHVFLHVWDEMREELGVALNDEERAEQIPTLYAAAVDLQADIATRATTAEGAELSDEQLVAEARMRARLLPEVSLLKAGQETRRELDALAPPSHTAWASPAEVAAQLRMLRRRREAAGHTGPAPAGPAAVSELASWRTTSWAPDWAIPPGEVLAELLEERQMPATALAEKAKLPTETVDGIMNATTVITPDIAGKLESVLGTEAQFWLNLETFWQQHLAQQSTQPGNAGRDTDNR